MIYTLRTMVNFGKHRGKTIQEIISEDHSYIEWAIDEIDNFQLDGNAATYLNEMYYDYEDDWWHDGWPGNFGDW